MSRTTPRTLTYRDRPEDEDEHVQAIERATDVSPEVAAKLIDAAFPLWNVMADLGWTDDYTVIEARRVSTEALVFIRHRANCSGHECSFCTAWESTHGG